MAKPMGLVISLFNIASAWEVPFGKTQYVYNFYDLPVSSFVLYSPLLTANGVDLVVAHDGLLCIMEIVTFFIVSTLICTAV